MTEGQEQSFGEQGILGLDSYLKVYTCVHLT